MVSCWVGWIFGFRLRGFMAFLVVAGCGSSGVLCGLPWVVGVWI